MTDALRHALDAAGLPAPTEVQWEIPREARHGDYATNAALALAREARRAPRPSSDRRRLVSARNFFARFRAGGYHLLSPRCAAAPGVFEHHRPSDGRIEARARRRRVARTHRGAVGDPA
ncbi:MAG: hypothetical protein ACRELW_09720 [Candidatus Rokuibacteriota bacterium]